jgi:hypothetical protein
MYTNQIVVPGTECAPERRCLHEPGQATAQTCAYLRALARIGAWVALAERAHANGDGERQLLGQLWVLQAELSYALDHCPNAAANGCHGDDASLLGVGATQEGAQA